MRIIIVLYYTFELLIAITTVLTFLCVDVYYIASSDCVSVCMLTILL